MELISDYLAADASADALCIINIGISWLYLTAYLRHISSLIQASRCLLSNKIILFNFS